MPSSFSERCLLETWEMRKKKNELRNFMRKEPWKERKGGSSLTSHFPSSFLHSVWRGKKHSLFPTCSRIGEVREELLEIFDLLIIFSSHLPLFCWKWINITKQIEGRMKTSRWMNVEHEESSMSSPQPALTLSILLFTLPSVHHPLHLL